MPLPTGLLPVLVFFLTVGIALPVAIGAQLVHRIRSVPFATALRMALLAVGGMYLVGIVAVWWIAGGIEAWEIAITLLLAGLGAFGGFVIVPLLVGARLIRYVHDVETETALGLATYGLLLAMLAVFGVFIAPGGLAQDHLLHLGGPQTCLVGFCGISISLVTVVLVELLIAVLGPGVIGLVLYVFGDRSG